ncbi:alpha-mannosidase [Rubritalea tangerina]|uniref:Alpha-mannosidase n=1 Tax=Rubritalea tangerina TaxID=430798 RepID=A0ABW4Z8I7_9BACT
MQKLTKVYEKRIATAAERLLNPLIYPKSIPLEIAAYEVAGPPISYEEAKDATYAPIAEGQSWGAQWDTTWFKVTTTIPNDWANESVVARINLSFDHHEGFGREGLIYLDGTPTTAINRNRQAIPLADPSQGGEVIEFFIEAAANPGAQWGWTDGELLDPKYGGDHLYALKTAQLSTKSNTAYQLSIDFNCCHQAMLVLPETSPRRGQLLRALNEVCTQLEKQSPEALESARAILANVLSKRNGDTNHQISAVGHCHIDTAWCWPLRETIRKCARSFSSALRLMEKHPHYTFVCSQPQQYAWMKAYYPSIYQDIKAAIKRGQWEAIGCMWIEADCNIPSGESLVRQTLHGKQFYQQEFDLEITDLWLPDVFGYAASLPQILVKSGVDSFLTQKISWSDTNKFPHHTFQWQGLDGTKIFTHFPPVDTYNCQLTAKDLKRSEENFQETDRATRALIPYGYGDGGGGPTDEMLESLKRWENFEGLPKVETSTVKEFFAAAKVDAIDLPTWRGELYLELHRGTLTSQAKNKLGNRKGELLLRDAEFLQTIASIVNPGELLESDPAPDRAVYDVPAHIHEKESSITAVALDRAWKLLLLNQFHDIIPGSSINWVYQDSDRDYETIQAIGNAVLTSASQRVSQQIDTSEIQDPLVVWNTLAHERTEIIALPDGELTEITVPQCGYTTISASNPPKQSSPKLTLTQSPSGFIINNGLIEITLNHDGTIQSLIDLELNRETLSGPANLFQLHHDIPNFWNAWDLDVFYTENTENLNSPKSLHLHNTNDLQCIFTLKFAFGDSTLTQKMTISAGTKRIDFDTEVNWQERDRLLKVAFPTNIHSLRASYDIQFGHVERPTHDNTSWDAAKFEVPVHQWADLSEGDYGVAILNDSKYAMDIREHTMRLTLLKSANAPDPEADRGTHRFSYALYPHAGTLQQSDVIEQASAFNSPLLVQPTEQSEGKLPSTQSLIKIDKPGVQLAALKLSEKSQKPVTRIVETRNSRGPITISSPILQAAPTPTDLLERPLENIPHQTSIQPFEIQTHIWQV